MHRSRCGRNFVASAFAAIVCLGSAAAAAEGILDRHAPHLLSPARKPAGVPANYVLTHNGFFHPSCVVVVGSDEVVGADRVIRGLDGTEHARFEACAYERYGADGRPGAPVHAPPAPAAAALYDGYIVSYAYWGDLPTAPTLTTNWTVPLAPKTVADQDIAFFNDILTTAGGGDILQPVLDFNGESQNHWAIESEHCCISGNDMQTTPVVVNVGDAIRGTVTGSNCAPNGVCQNWSVTTADLTTGKSTTLNTTAPSGVPNGVSPASLESYGVTACDLFPASGKSVFTDNALTSSAGTQALKYDLTILDGVNAEVPRNCGYSGAISGNDYTLVYGEVPASGGGGAGGTGTGGNSDAGGGAGASTGGAGGHGGGGAASGSGGALGRGGASGNGGNGGSAAPGGTSSTAGSSSMAGSNAAGQASTPAGGAAAGGAFGSGGTSGGSASGASSAGAAGRASGGGASDASGCSCTLARSRERAAWSAFACLLPLLAGVALTRRRRTRRSARARVTIKKYLL